MLIDRLITPNISNSSELIAIDFNNQKHLYSSLIKKIKILSAGLQTHLNVNDALIVCLPNSLELIYYFYACLNTGITFIPIPEEFSEDEALRIINISQAKNIVITSNKLKSMKEIDSSSIVNIFLSSDHDEISNCESNKKIYNVRELFNSTRKFISFEPKAEQTAMVIPTSGTTGVPKCVMIPYRNILNTFSTKFVIDKESTLILNSTLHHAGPLYQILHFFYFGAKVIMLEKIAFDSVIDALIEFKPTHFTTSPSVFNQLLDQNESVLSALRELKYCVSRGDFVPAELQKCFIDKIGLPLISIYGLTESGPCMINMASREDKLGSLGQVINGVQIRLVDKNSNDVVSGEIGEVLCKTPRLMNGYLNDIESSQPAFTDGWFKTGDLAYLDGDNYYWFSGRIKSQIVTMHGPNVDPSEVESVICEHLAVQSAAIVGIETTHNWQKVVAFVVLKSKLEISESSLLSFLNEKLMYFKVPEKIYFMQELPMTHSGKVNRKKLKQLVKSN